MAVLKEDYLTRRKYNIRALQDDMSAVAVAGEAAAGDGVQVAEGATPVVEAGAVREGVQEAGDGAKKGGEEAEAASAGGSNVASAPGPATSGGGEDGDEDGDGFRLF